MGAPHGGPAMSSRRPLTMRVLLPIAVAFVAGLIGAWNGWRVWGTEGLVAAANRDEHVAAVLGRLGMAVFFVGLGIMAISVFLFLRATDRAGRA